MKDLFPTLVYALSMFVVIFFSIKWIDSNIVKLLFGFAVGIVYYFFIAYLTKSPELKTCYSLIKEYKNKIKK